MRASSFLLTLGRAGRDAGGSFREPRSRRACLLRRDQYCALARPISNLSKQMTCHYLKVDLFVQILLCLLLEMINGV